MKKYFVFLLLSSCITSISKAQPKNSDLFIELGQDHTLKGSISKVWIENSKIISALNVNNKLIIKALQIGQSQIRVNENSFKVNVIPLGSLKTYQVWTQLSQKFIQIKVDYCEELVCLKGKIYTFKEFQKVIQALSENKSPLYLAFDIHPNIKIEIQKYLDHYQREKGLTPLKVIYSQPWKVQYSVKETATDYKDELARIGIRAIESKQKVEIADNIKVAIQVTEVKKDFGRQLGIKYPGTYSATVLDGNQFQKLPFDLALNANENEGQVKVLASPNLVCRSGKEAEFFAGGEFPIRILNFKVNDVVWKKYGIGLKVKPMIDSVGQMSLQIESEISTLDASTTVDGIPGIKTNKISSYFDLIESRTIALSGLIKNEQGESSEGLPFLKQIPILGRLFSSHDFRESQSELVIFVTPELVQPE